jgi:UDP-glucose 4-epimerase
MVQTLVTGGTGFIGTRLISALARKGGTARVLTRNERLVATGPVAFFVGDLLHPGGLGGLCEEVDTVFHLAGYAHDVRSDDLADLHWQTTVEGTRGLLAQATRSGVRRFLFVSSVKAMGEGGEECLDETMSAEPTGAYGRARREAERLVLAAGREHGMHVCVLRLPLVYGPGNKGNIPRMIEAIDRGLFPPPPEVRNRRSMVHVDDVVQALLLAAECPAANGQVYIVTDEQVYSTREIYSAICHALGQQVPTWSTPAWALRAGAVVGDALQRVLRRPMPLNRTTLDKLLGSACYSSDKIRRELGFRSSHNLFDSLPEMIAEYRATARPAMAPQG